MMTSPANDAATSSIREAHISNESSKKMSSIYTENFDQIFNIIIIITITVLDVVSKRIIKLVDTYVRIKTIMRIEWSS